MEKLTAALLAKKMANHTGSSEEVEMLMRNKITEFQNQIVDDVLYKLWEFRENKSMEIKSSYAACNSIYTIIQEFKK